jgi:MarR family
MALHPIWWLNEQGEDPTQVRLAAQAGTKIKVTSQVLKALEKKALIEREVDPADTGAATASDAAWEAARAACGSPSCKQWTPSSSRSCRPRTPWTSSVA